MPVKTLRLRLTAEQARLLAKAAKEEGYASKSEFVRYALARALEDKLSIQTIDEVFEARREIPDGKKVPLDPLKSRD